MNMPGFTAESSLHNTGERYQANALPDGLQCNDKIIPQVGATCKKLLRLCTHQLDPHDWTCDAWLKYC